LISVSISQAHVRFRQQQLFVDLDFKLAAGKTTCLLGPSGVGKSTLCRLLAGLPVSTQLHCFAYIEASDLKPLAGRIAYMSQRDGLMPWASVMDNVLMPVKLSGLSTKPYRAKALKLLKQLGLPNTETMKPVQLSGGMRQRVAMARTLILERSVILMDEPFTSLDAITRFRLQELAADLLENKTALLVTHDPQEALRLGHHIYVLNGSPAKIHYHIDLSHDPVPRDLDSEVMTQYHNRILKALVGDEAS